MSTCNRCAISAWHPEAHSCTHTDCELRGRTAPKTAVAFPTPGATAGPAANDAEPLNRLTAAQVVQQPARDRQPERLGCEVERVPVHAAGMRPMLEAVSVE